MAHDEYCVLTLAQMVYIEYRAYRNLIVAYKILHIEKIAHTAVHITSIAVTPPCDSFAFNTMWL